MIILANDEPIGREIITEGGREGGGMDGGGRDRDRER